MAPVLAVHEATWRQPRARPCEARQTVGDVEPVRLASLSLIRSFGH